MYSRKYEKIFVLLKEELAGYSVGDRPIKGNASIEIKGGNGRLNVYIQAVDRDIIKNAYYIYLISSGIKRSIGICAGEIDIDEKGQGKLKFDFNPDNVAGSNLSIEQINVVALFAGNSNAQAITAPMVGYTDGKINWKRDFRFFVEEEPLTSFIAAEVTNERAIEALEDLEKEEALKKEDALKMPDALKEEIEIAEKQEVKEVIAAEEAIVFEQQTEETPIEESFDDEKNVYATAEDFFSGYAESSVHSTFRSIVNRFRSQLQSLEEDGILSVEDILGEAMGKLNAAEQIVKSVVEKEGENKAESKDKGEPRNKAEREAEIKSESNAEIADKSKIDFIGKKSNTFQTKIPPSSVSMPFTRPSIIEIEKKEFLHNNIDIFIKNERLKPFPVRGEVHWVRTEPRELVLLPFTSVEDTKKPLITASFKRYKHIIAGRSRINGIWRYFVGVPERYRAEDRRSIENEGFNQFLSNNGSDVSDGDYGYWIMNVL